MSVITHDTRDSGLLASDDPRLGPKDQSNAIGALALSSQSADDTVHNALCGYQEEVEPDSVLDCLPTRKPIPKATPYSSMARGSILMLFSITRVVSNAASV